MRDAIIQQPKWGSLSQGLIFSCAAAEDYKGNSVHGLLINARCDIEHGKIRSYHYVPIVEFSDWILQDHREILVSRARSINQGKLIGLLREAKLSPDILEVEPIEIAASLIPSVGKNVKRVSDFLADNNLIRSMESRLEINTEDLPGWIQKESSKIIEECIRHKLAGYYFLPHVESNAKESSGFVVLLREIRHVPRRIAEQIASGLEAHNCPPDGEASLSFSQGRDIAFPVGQLRSPEIEHLLQTLALNFTRIGVQDPDPLLLRRLQIDHTGIEA